MGIGPLFLPHRLKVNVGRELLTTSYNKGKQNPCLQRFQIVWNHDAVFTAQVEDATPTSAHGRAESGDWWVSCNEDAGHCSVMVEQLHLRAAFLDKNKGGAQERRLFWDLSAKSNALGEERVMNECPLAGSYEVTPGCVYHSWLGIVENPQCGTDWCHGACCYPDRATLVMDCPTCVANGDGRTRHYSSSDLGLR